jgi:cation diffusion facilitator CzcD-associated flavoprotein CzcO
LQCDFVVVCTGTFSEPLVPEIPGSERFSGTVVHSSEATDPALVVGKRVVVVGAGKSALDCAAWATEHAQRCTLVFRAPHWMSPRMLPGGIPNDRLVMGRYPELFFRYHRLNRLERFSARPGKGSDAGGLVGDQRAFSLAASHAGGHDPRPSFADGT